MLNKTVSKDKGSDQLDQAPAHHRVNVQKQTTFTPRFEINHPLRQILQGDPTGLHPSSPVLASQVWSLTISRRCCGCVGGACC